MPRLKFALKSITLVLSCAVIVYILLFRLETLSRLLPNGDSKADLMSFPLESSEPGAPSIRLADANADINLLILVSPGAHCVACVEIASRLDIFIRSKFGNHGVKSYVVADGTQTGADALRIYRAGQNREGTIVLDREGKLRELLGLTAGPGILGLSKKGKLLFYLPLDHDLWSGAVSEDLVASLIELFD